ncbi:MAG: hypothetical protein IJ062_05345 [Firmicutes bacterium]|nr:hypothetical protein [Bacillota bacterium]
MKTIIKNNDNSKAVNKRREDVNGEQVENSQSKSVRSKKDIIKQAEEKATYRDYSGKIRFGDSERKKPEKSGKAFDKVKKAKQAEKRKELIIPETTVDIVKPADSVDKVKPASETDIVKPQYSAPTQPPDKAVDIDSPTYKKALKKQLKLYASRKSAVNKPKPRLDVSDMPQGIIKTETQAPVIEQRSGVDDIISTSQDYAISATAKDMVDGTVTYTDGTQRSKLSKMAHQRQLEAMKNLYKDDSRPDTYNAAFEYREDEQQTQRQQYSEMVVKHSLPIKEHKEVPVKSSMPPIKKQAKAEQNKTQRTTVVSLGAGVVKSNIHSAMKNSEDETLQIAEGTITAAETAKGILKPETVSVKKRDRKINREKTAEAAAALGIKHELKQDMKNIILEKADQSGKLLKVGGKSVIKAIKEDIAEKGNEDLAFKAVDDVIKTGETAVAAKDVIVAGTNGAVDVYHTAKSTIKAVKNAPQSAKNIYKKAQDTKRKYDAFKRLQTKQKMAVIKSKAANKAKKVAGEALKSAKSAAIKVLAILLVNVVLIVAICGVVVAAIGSFIWQTPSDLDTTAIIKLISEKDCKMQEKWAGKGYAAVTLEGMNDNNNDRSYSCVYALAVDVPLDRPVVKTSVDREGSDKMPTYSGFNKVYHSYDEMLESYRWTTEDYRAALAYIQVKKENLGWFSNLFGFVGEQQLKNAAEALHKATYDYGILHKHTDTDGNVTESYESPIYSKTYRKDKATTYFYFGRKYSVKFLIDNDIVRFDADDAKNNAMKEKFEYTYKYGNFAVANLSFPLDIDEDETIESRISKHFGKQVVLTYTPPERSPDKTMYGSISKKSKYHLATDLSADAGDIIYAPISGLCKVKQREGRGFEYVICTSYNGADFDYTKDGYLIKISCSSASFVSLGAPTLVHQGDALGKVAHNIAVNTSVPDKDNDTENEDIMADKLFPCCTSTVYHEIGGDVFNIPEAEQDHIHIEMYKLPCDFSSAADMEKNVLAPELFFDYSREEE